MPPPLQNSDAAGNRSERASAQHDLAERRSAGESDRAPASTLAELLASGWRSRSVKEELRENLVRALAAGEPLFPGIVGYDDTVIPELVNGILAGHDLLFLGEKGQAKSRLMRGITRLLDPAIPYLDAPGAAVHEDPLRPITAAGRALLASAPPEAVPIRWWPRAERYAERLAPGTRFADVIGELDPAKLTQGVSIGAEEALHFGLIPRMHRGIFAMNELPDLDDSVQVGLFNVLEERDVQIRGYPVRFDLDLVVLFSANPATYNRSGKVIPQLKDRIGTTIQTHYPRERALGMAITRQEALAAPGFTLGGDWPVVVPPFMEAIVEEISVAARRNRNVDHASGVSARFSIANYRTMVASARRRGIVLGERPAVARISDLAHLHASAAGKLELDLMGVHQMTERQVLESILAEAIRTVFGEYCDAHGLDAIAEIFAKGVRIEVGDMLPSAQYAERLRRIPPAWEKAFEVNPAESPAVRASCVEFVLAGLHATERISRATRHGRVTYEL
ncbi:MAG TPA: magnesium chelatase [Phycisphaerales bacterium]|nr:magnesium chelatase [Phycisphaerales bacterium]HMP37616.1 magnesium chelatase [Phycisphaerales bacterium]